MSRQGRHRRTRRGAAATRCVAAALVRHGGVHPGNGVASCQRSRFTV